MEILQKFEHNMDSKFQVLMQYFRLGKFTLKLSLIKITNKSKAKFVDTFAQL